MAINSKQKLSDIKIGSKVQIITGCDRKIQGIVININYYREPTMIYAVDIGWSDLLFVGRDRLRLLG